MLREILNMNLLTSRAKIWPENFFEETYVFLQNTPIKRESQGNYLEREKNTMKYIMATMLICTILALISCSVFYPNWEQDNQETDLSHLEPAESNSNLESQVTAESENGTIEEQLSGKLVARGTSVEAMVYDPKSQRIFFSHKVSQSSDQENSYIGRLDSEGNLDIPDFAIKLQSVKGITILGEILYVIDGFQIWQYDHITGKKLGFFDLEKIQEEGIKEFCNILAKNSNLYISDPKSGQILLFNPIEETARILASIDNIYCLAENINKKESIFVANHTTIFELNVEGKVLRELPYKFKKISGLVYDKKNNLYIADQATGEISKIDEQEKLTTITKEISQLGSIAVSNNILVFSCSQGIRRIVFE